jgi:hypothetical protein
MNSFQPDPEPGPTSRPRARQAVLAALADRVTPAACLGGPAIQFFVAEQLDGGNGPPCADPGRHPGAGHEPGAAERARADRHAGPAKPQHDTGPGDRADHRSPRGQAAGCAIYLAAGTLIASDPVAADGLGASRGANMRRHEAPASPVEIGPPVCVASHPAAGAAAASPTPLGGAPAWCPSTPAERASSTSRRPGGRTNIDG